jgi:hypothetical protein
VRAWRRRGAAIVYAIVSMSVGFALASLAVEYGRVQTIKAEAQTLADAACRAAAAGYNSGGMSEARSRARGRAALSKVDGVHITLADGDFIFGHWNKDTGQLQTPGSGRPMNAIHVTVRRTVALTFASLFGKSSVDVSATATAQAPQSQVFGGFAALSGMDFKNTAFIGGYNSASTTSPTAATATASAALTSNGTISFKNNTTVNGDINVGPAGAEEHQNGLTMTGSVNHLANEVPAPPESAWSPSPNPLGIPQNYTVNNNTTLPGGTYWFTSLTVNKKLTFSGPATVYVNGNVTMGDDIVTSGSIPSNLKIYQTGNNRTFTFNNNGHLVAVVQAAGSALTAKNKLSLYGLGLYKSIDVKNSAEFYFDQNSSATAQAMATAAGTTEGNSIALVE